MTDQRRPFSFSDKIAIVEIKGIITQSTEIIEEIRHYADDETVKAVILRIDSPGGGVGPSQEIHREVVKLKTKKKVLASMGSVAASGGYYIACASDLIVANPGTITGSIGVVMEFTNLEELLKKIGVKGVVLKGGEHKDIGSPFREMTPGEKKIMQEVIDNVHQQFIKAVAEGRKMEQAKVIPVADGRIFTGEQAKQFGLVDEMGNLEDTVDMAAKLVNIDGRPTVIYPKKKVYHLGDVSQRDGIHGRGELARKGDSAQLSSRLPGRLAGFFILSEAFHDSFHVLPDVLFLFRISEQESRMIRGNHPGGVQ